MLRTFTVDITVGAGTSFPITADSLPFSGRILDIVWDGVIKGAHADITGDPDIDVTVVETGEVLWTEANVAAGKTHRPAVAVNTNDGAAATQLDFYNLVGERLRFSIGGISAANPVTGRFTIRYLEPQENAGPGVDDVTAGP